MGIQLVEIKVKHCHGMVMNDVSIDPAEDRRFSAHLSLSV